MGNLNANKTAIKTQGGIALIATLLLLLVMTLIGTSAMKTTTLEEKMAGNTKNVNVAFQASETGLRAAEQWIRDLGPVPVINGIQAGVLPSGTLHGITNQPQYTVQLKHREKDHLGVETYVDSNKAKTDYYRIDASGEAAAGSGARVELQSVYVWRYEI